MTRLSMREGKAHPLPAILLARRSEENDPHFLGSTLARTTGTTVKSQAGHAKSTSGFGLEGGSRWQE